MAQVQKLGREIQLAATVDRFDLVDGSASTDVVGRSLDVLKARVSLVKTGTHVEYTIRVVFEGQSWTFKRRFNEFSSLNDALKRQLASTPEMPAKSVVRQFSPEYLEARKHGLNAFLKELCRRRDALNCRELQDFLQLPQRVPAFSQPSGLDPVQSAEIHDSSFAISAFDYDPVQGLLLLGASDASWTSRVDTKITNIKMPWEKQAPNLPSSQMSLWQQTPVDLKFKLVHVSRYTSLISSVVLTAWQEKGMCLCGLSDGTVGCQPLRSDRGSGSMTSVLPLVRHTSAVVALATDELNQLLFSASADKAVMVFNLRRQLIECEVKTPAPPVLLRHCQDQRRLFAALNNGTVAVWDTTSLPLQRYSVVPDGAVPSGLPVAAMDYDPDTSTLFTGSKEGILVWAMKASDLGCWGRKLGQFSEMASAPTALAWAKSSREILAGFPSGAVVVFDLDCGQPTYAFQAHTDAVTMVSWLDAPRRLLTAGKDKALKIWDFPSLQRVPLESVSLGPSLTGSDKASGSRAKVRTGGYTDHRGSDPLLGLPTGALKQNGTDKGSAVNPLSSDADLPSYADGGPRLAFVPPADPLAGGGGSPSWQPNGAARAARGSSSISTFPTEAPRPAKSSALKEDSDDDLVGWDK